MNWHFIGVESPKEITLKSCSGSLTGGDGYGDGDGGYDFSSGDGNGDGYGYSTSGGDGGSAE